MSYFIFIINFVIFIGLLFNSINNFDIFLFIVSMSFSKKIISIWFLYCSTPHSI